MDVRVFFVSPRVQTKVGKAREDFSKARGRGKTMLSSVTVVARSFSFASIPKKKNALASARPHLGLHSSALFVEERGTLLRYERESGWMLSGRESMDREPRKTERAIEKREEEREEWSRLPTIASPFLVFLFFLLLSFLLHTPSLSHNRKKSPHSSLSFFFYTTRVSASLYV